ncbi:MAG TPA: hypothetical protein VFU63_05040 [Ktedonobacterales bacterium]|nr:hypothetical protein [Ktedonobacterales bacterium]
MRWFWQRLRRKQTTAQDPVETPPPIAATQATGATTATTVQRAPTSSGRLGQPRQLSSELLVLARDYLQAAG